MDFRHELMFRRTSNLIKYQNLIPFYCTTMKENSINIVHNEILNNKISIGFVIHLPENSIINRIKTAEECGFMIYIFDNSPKIDFVRNFCKNLKNCKYITCGKNIGLGVGISAICAQAYYDFNSALLFFDQDTCYNHETLKFIQDFYERQTNLETNYSAIVFNSKNVQKKNVEGHSEIKDVLMAISSGSLFFLKNLEMLNWHNTNYFIDCVDYEFCLNSNNHHFKIGEYSATPGFDHQAEQPDKKYRIFGKERFMRKYSSKRFFDYFFSSLRLIFQSLKTNNFKFAKATFRSLIIYLYFQCTIRIIKIYK